MPLLLSPADEMALTLTAVTTSGQDKTVKASIYKHNAPPPLRVQCPVSQLKSSQNRRLQTATVSMMPLSLSHFRGGTLSLLAAYTTSGLAPKPSSQLRKHELHLVIDGYHPITNLPYR